jgi:DNA sulfur modification protein DndD
MYISQIRLTNWRSYAESVFNFQKPEDRRCLYLIGALNGHGKTSLLFSLYLGIFGRFGLTHTEGFSRSDNEDNTYYREAIRQFRRSTANPEDPTSVEIVFSPVRSDEKNEIRIIRRWFFTTDNQPKKGDSFERIELYIDGMPQKLSKIDAAINRIERYLFKADVMPAFFFDGEQAQRLINNSGQDGMKKAVEVLYGTRTIDESLTEVKHFIQKSRSILGGKKNADSQQEQLDKKLKERDALEEDIKLLNDKISGLSSQHEKLENERQNITTELTKKGGMQNVNIGLIQNELNTYENEKRNAEKDLTTISKSLGISLAISRLSGLIEQRLFSEAARESWENIRKGTIERLEEVINIALPFPQSSDEILKNLDNNQWNALRNRFAQAIERIYSPPPNNCAKEYIFGHVKGENRTRLISLINKVKLKNTNEFKLKTNKLSGAKEKVEEIKWRIQRIESLPDDIESMKTRLNEINEEIIVTSKSQGGFENERKKLNADLGDVCAIIGKLQEQLATLGPEQQRIAIAERVRTVLSALNEKLKPLTIQRLEDTVSKQFTQIADKRYQTGKIHFQDNGSPVIRRNNLPDHYIETMSGFERRSFGISFSLALAEITKKRIPLVIDTPLGNADIAYRSRLLKALTNVDLDQVIILTHDAEVAGSLFEDIESQVNSTHLVVFDSTKNESIVYPDKYFDGVGK